MTRQLHMFGSAGSWSPPPKKRGIRRGANRRYNGVCELCMETMTIDVRPGPNRRMAHRHCRERERNGRLPINSTYNYECENSNCPNDGAASVRVTKGLKIVKLKYCQPPAPCRAQADYHNNTEFYQRAALKRKYNLPDDLIDALIERTVSCGACGAPTPGGKHPDGVLYVDEDHDTGLVEGPLCHACNIMKGIAKTPQRARQVADYMEHPTWVHLGIYVATPKNGATA